MGRDKRNEGSSDHFTIMVRNFMETPAWRALSSTAQSLYPWLKLEWHGPKANNNGRIRLSVRQAAACLGVTPDTAARAFRDLQAKGFLHITQAARLGSGGEAKGSSFELTELTLPNGQCHTGRRLYMQWSPAADFPVMKVMANNPEGRNKTRTCRENRDSNVTKIMTGRKSASRKS